jgi:cysteinyl-tRNA synthetase
MSAEYLGQPFDIHGGGDDLIFPHHENEIAQAEGITGTEFVRYWLHNGRLDIRGEKMSKSLKNFVDIPSALEAYPAHELRLFFCSAHYRSQMDYTPEALSEARAVAARFRAFIRNAPRLEVPDDEIESRLQAFGAAMDDDLNTPGALAALHELVSEGNQALEAGRVHEGSVARGALAEALGVLGVDLSGDDETQDLVGPLVELLLAQREDARKRKDFDAADAIRDRLTDMGITVEDSAEGPRWYVA